MISKSFTAAGVSLVSLLKPGDRAAYSLTGTYTGTIVLEQCKKGASAYESIRNIAGAIVTVTDIAGAGVIENLSGRTILIRFRSTGAMTGTAVASLVDIPASTIKEGVGVPTTIAIASEGGSQQVHQTTLFFSNLPLTLRDAEQGQGAKIYDFPEGRIAILGALGSVALITTSVLANTLNASKTYNWGVGSMTQANPTLATTEQNIIPTTNGTSSATINVAGAVSKGQLAAGLHLDGTAAPIDAYLNIGVAGELDIDGDATVLVNGFVTITWVNLGDV